MFAYLFVSFIEILGFVGVSVLLYQIFLSDFIKAKRLEVKNAKSKYDSLDKIAQVKLVSDDRKDIERFITENAQYLSAEMVKKLVERIDMIKNDHIIETDTLLKKKFEELEESEEEEPVVTKRATRKK